MGDRLRKKEQPYAALFGVLSEDIVFQDRKRQCLETSFQSF